MSIATNYKQYLTTLRQLAGQFQTDMACLIQEEQYNYGEGENDYCLAFRHARYDGDKVIIEAARNIVTRLIWRAEKTFSPRGGRLSIDKMEVYEACSLEDSAGWLNLDPEKVWAHLEATYGGDKGQEQSWQQQAAILIDSFNLKRQDAIQSKGGKTILNLHIYTEKSYRGKVMFHHGSAEDVAKTFQALRCFALWADREGLAAAMYNACRVLGDYHHEITSRATYGGFGCQITTFYKNFEFKFDAALAEQLQIFISTFGTPEQRAA